MKWWPFTNRSEKRQSGGDFQDGLLRLIEAQASGTAADTASTAAVEAAAGALSRAFAAAEVRGPGWVRDAVTPEFLGQVGRDLIRTRGGSLHVVDVNPMGRVSLLPCSSWHFEGDVHPDTWRVRATLFGPSTSQTRHVGFESIVFVKWGSSPATPYVNTGPLGFAATTARLGSELERSLADESGGPIANLLPVPAPTASGDPDDESDPSKLLRQDISTARGRALILETTAAGHGEGATGAPRRDWVASPGLGPEFPAASMATDPRAGILSGPGCLRYATVLVPRQPKPSATRSAKTLAPEPRAAYGDDSTT